MSADDDKVRVTFSADTDQFDAVLNVAGQQAQRLGQLQELLAGLSEGRYTSEHVIARWRELWAEWSS